jgi:hypothetical protein
MIASLWVSLYYYSDYVVDKIEFKNEKNRSVFIAISSVIIITIHIGGTILFVTEFKEYLPLYSIDWNELVW